ncbi:hypothetical protein OESDEN_07378 [Oesophagostomum dentatum]|uniref:Uncharacterized protein n=1 Tax=Oesophagostomum dentatum TaxID=61180 RepID=A0A0B1T5A1_OESDE|nr:hypothetical protein OESDEN_07378 [Oesophagostomum dentatum]
MATFGVVIVGLSMVSVCIDVVREKLELMYMALLKKVLADYMEAVKNGDPDAAKGMMAGFKGKAKFLLPLISKERGAKAMSKFREDCTAKLKLSQQLSMRCFKGIDPPAVLTHLDPKTGMPEFASANKEDFSDYIEQAAEKRAEEERKEMQRLNQLLEQSAVRSAGESRSTLSLDTGKKLRMLDSYCQTTTSLVPETKTVSTVTEMDVQELDVGEKCALCGNSRPEVRSAGVQPEVTSIFVIEDSESEIATGHNVESALRDTSVAVQRSIADELASFHQTSETALTSNVTRRTLQSGQTSIPSPTSVQTEVIGFDSDIKRSAAVVDQPKIEIRYLKSTGAQTDEPFSSKVAHASTEYRLKSDNVTERAAKEIEAFTRTAVISNAIRLVRFIVWL